MNNKLRNGAHVVLSNRKYALFTLVQINSSISFDILSSAKIVQCNNAQ